LPRGLPTIAHAFAAHGYDTAWIGKWHLSGFKERDGRAALYRVPREDRGGFQTWIGYDNNNSQWDSWVHGHDRDGRERELERLPGYETDALTDRLIAYLSDQASRRQGGAETPFFAALSVQPPHDPYVAPPEYMARHNPAGLRLRANVPPVPRVEERARRELAGACAMIENLDANVGRIVAALDALNLRSHTYLMFFSDHGDLHGSHGQFRKMAPWEESIRIPFIVAGGASAYDFHHSDPGVVPNHVDLAPTTLGLCGLPVPDGMVGFDYSGHLLRSRTQGESPDSAYLQCVVPTGHGDSVDRPWRGVVTRDGWKYVCLEGQPWLLFDLNEDPFELVNLAHNNRFRVERKRLHARLSRWVHETGDSFRLPLLPE
jgi:arylsulfatase A-like enzyme